VIEPAWMVGVGMTRFGVRQDFSVNDLTRDAVTIVLRDAGAELGDIDAAYFGKTAHGLLEGRHVVTGQIALRSMGFEQIPIINVENAGSQPRPRYCLSAVMDHVTDPVMVRMAWMVAQATDAKCVLNCAAGNDN
jgi:hypothetical protein